MKHLTIAGMAAIMLLAVVSCSGSGGSDRSDGPASYLAVSKSNVGFIKWRATSNGHLRGTITEAYLAGSAPTEKMSVSSAPFSGTIRGSSVRLTFAGLFFLHTGTRGVLSGGRLTLHVPQSGGAIRRVTFSQSDVPSYHTAITTLQETVRHANRQAAQQGQQSQKPASGQAEQGARSSLSALNHQSNGASGGILAGGLARFAAHIRTARSDLVTEKHDASGNNRYCSAAFRVSGDAQSVDGDLESVQGDVKAMMADISIVRADIANAKAHLRHLSRTGLPVPDSASNVIGSAKANLAQAIATGNSYIDQINALDAHARSMASKMARGPCSGAQSGNSTRPILHIR